MSCASEPGRRVLHLLVRPDDGLAAEIIAGQRLRPDCEVKVLDLTKPDCDYREVLEQIFRADSIQVW